MYRYMTTKAMQTVIENISERLGILERRLFGRENGSNREAEKKILDETFGMISKKRGKALESAIRRGRKVW